MDVNDIYSQLQALFKLYGLLRSHNDGTASDDHTLDENAQSFLKNLLDAEVEKLVQAHGEVTVTLLKLTPAGPMNQENVVTGSLPEAREKRCRVCLKSKIKKVEETNSEDGAQNSANVNVDQPRVSKVKGVLERTESRGLRSKATTEIIESGKWKTDDDELVPKQRQKNSAHGRFSSDKLSASDSVGSTINVDVEQAVHHVAPSRVEHGKRYTSKRKGINVSSKKRKNRNITIAPLRQQYPLKSSTNPGLYSSSGMCNGNSNYHSESEEHSSSTVSTRSLHDTMESSTMSNSETTTTSSKFSEAYSSSGNESRQSYDASLSETEMSSASYTPSLRGPKDSKISGRAAPWKTRKKEDGMWRKLKNRLQLKFHHFHHHHHPGGGDEHQKGKSWFSSRAAKAYEKKAEKKVESLLSSKAAKAMDKIEKSAAKNGKKDKSQFHGLMGAVLSHVNRPKKSKLEENRALHDAIKKKAKNKPQWADLTKKALKLRVGKRKPRLKMLPKIK